MQDRGPKPYCGTLRLSGVAIIGRTFDRLCHEYERSGARFRVPPMEEPPIAIAKPHEHVETHNVATSSMQVISYQSVNWIKERIR